MEIVKEGSQNLAHAYYTPVELAPTDHAGLRWMHTFGYKFGVGGRMGGDKRPII
jgi:hypothetical protein